MINKGNPALKAKPRRRASRRPRGRLTLEWDYGASPLWRDGVNVCLAEAADPGARAEIEAWYERFSLAEEVIDEVGRRPHPEAEVRGALVALKGLMAQGEKLAARIGATLRVDYGHDPTLRDLEFEVFGEGDRDIKGWWERQGRLEPSGPGTQDPPSERDVLRGHRLDQGRRL